jgi:hypothetical protein
MTTIFKWVARSALYIEWFMTSSRFCLLVAAAVLEVSAVADS